MRGDSLRDLYAKTLALLGLAVLAGVGALVDYWPAGLTFPAAPAPFLLPEPADRTAIAREPLEVMPLSESNPRPERVATARLAPVLVFAQPLSSQIQAPATSLADELSPEATLVLADNELSSASSPAAIAMTMPGPPLTIDQVPVAEEVELPVPMRASVAAVSGGHDDDGLITGAFKKTGSSIVKTGARTGASIFDAMRAVSGMVRRALPTD